MVKALTQKKQRRVGGILDAASRSALVRVGSSPSRFILDADSQRAVMAGDWVGRRSGLVVNSSHPIERGSERRANGLSLSERAIPMRQTKG